jgi:hypothetical protein
MMGILVKAKQETRLRLKSIFDVQRRLPTPPAAGLQQAYLY